MRRKIFICILSALIIMTFAPVMTYAQADLSSGYRILLQSPSYGYIGEPIEAKFYVVSDSL